MISIIVHVPLWDVIFQLILLSIISRINEREALFQCGEFLDMQIEMQPLFIDWAKEEAKMAFAYLCLLLIIQF